jgi:hypothetical protein
MNALISGLPKHSGYTDTPFMIFEKLGDFNRGSPSEIYVFLDEREESIGDGAFYMDLWNFNMPNAWQFVNWPASYHNRAGAFSFADGHSVIQKWKDARTCPPIKRSGRLTPAGIWQTSPNNQDLRWLHQHASIRK